MKSHLKKLLFAFLILQALCAQASSSDQCSQQICFGSDQGQAFKKYCMSTTEDFWNSVDEWGPVVESANCYCPCKKYFNYESTENEGGPNALVP